MNNIQPSTTSYSNDHRQLMLETARNAIVSTLPPQKDVRITLDDYPPPLRQERASFITLNLKQKLRGCIGSLLAYRPLIQDITSNAQAAASKDPRFKPVSSQEYQLLEIHISILSIPQELVVVSREQLLDVLVPGVDGLIIEEAGRKATFLPSVWDQIPLAEDFLKELQLKAGLAPGKWTGNARVYHYTTEEFC